MTTQIRKRNYAYRLGLLIGFPVLFPILVAMGAEPRELIHAMWTEIRGRS